MRTPLKNNCGCENQHLLTCIIVRNYYYFKLSKISLTPEIGYLSLLGFKSVFNSEYEYNDHKNGNFIRMQGNYNDPRLEMITNGNLDADRTHYIKHNDDKHYGFHKNYTSGYEKFPNANGVHRRTPTGLFRFLQGLVQAKPNRLL